MLVLCFKEEATEPRVPKRIVEFRTFYGRHNVLVKCHVISSSPMTTDMFSMPVSQSRPSYSVHDLTPNITCDRTFITSNTTDTASGVHPHRPRF